MQALLSPVGDFMAQWSSAFWATLRETGPYLVLGLLFAGILHVLVPARIVLWALGHGGWRGALRGSLVGMPLPLCSCGVLPTALALRRQGASLSAATAFTIATPETSIDALAITAALLPAVFLGVRPIAALLLAFLVGTIVELFARTTKDELRVNVMKFARLNDASSQDCDDECGSARSSEICRVCGLMVQEPGEHAHGVWSRGRAVFGYAFGTFFADIATWLVLGLIVAAAIQTAMPEQGLTTTWLGRHPAIQVALAIFAAIPLYSCATATTPLAAVLMAKGLNPGAALAILLAGPATNIGNVFALKRELGVRITAAYYGTLLSLCWGIGVAFNLAWPYFSKHPGLMQIVGSTNGVNLLHAIPDWVEIGSAWIILVLTANLWLRSLLGKGAHEHDDHDHHDHHDHAGHGHCDESHVH